jgi:ABC-type sugar transport system ATPase subunit
VIQQVDTPLALYERPANAFVAGFIGSPEMNVQPKPGAMHLFDATSGQLLGG